MKSIDMSIVYWFHKVFIILKNLSGPNKFQLIKGAIKGCLEQWADGIDNSPAGRSPGQIGVKEKLGRLPREVIFIWGSWADGTFSLCEFWPVTA